LIFVTSCARRCAAYCLPGEPIAWRTTIVRSQLRVARSTRARLRTLPSRRICFASPGPSVFAELRTFRDHARPTRVFPHVFAHGGESVARAMRRKHERQVRAVGPKVFHIDPLVPSILAGLQFSHDYLKRQPYSTNDMSSAPHVIPGFLKVKTSRARAKNVATQNCSQPVPKMEAASPFYR